MIHNIKIKVSLISSRAKYRRIINNLSDEEMNMLREEVKRCKDEVKENIKNLFNEDLSFCMDYMEQFLESKDANCKLFFTTGLNIFLRTQEMEEVNIDLEGSEDTYKEKFFCSQGTIWGSTLEICISFYGLVFYYGRYYERK